MPGRLEDLSTVNTLTLACRPTLAFLERLRRSGRCRARPLRILDVGFGYGDMLRKVARWAARRRGGGAADRGGPQPRGRARAAPKATPGGGPSDGRTDDAFAYPGEVDLVISSLFTHHWTTRP